MREKVAAALEQGMRVYVYDHGEEVIIRRPGGRQPRSGLDEPLAALVVGLFYAYVYWLIFRG